MTRTITAMYDSRSDAEEAKRQLQSSGLSEGDITIVDQGMSGSTTTGTTYADGGESRGFFGALKDMFMPDEDRHLYSEGLRRGGFLLTARVDEDRCDEAIRLLDTSNAVDFENRTSEWRSSGWDADTTSLRAEETQTIPLAEERLRVGKREVERGTVRVRSYVEETPVHEEVSLREERVDVERRPVSDTYAARDAGDGLFEEREIELTERGEEAVVAKEAVVTEEVVLRPHTEERVEQIDDTVRRTDIDIDEDRDRVSLDADRTLTDESRTFRDDADHSISMDADGGRIEETEEERRERLERDGDLRP
jgi:uncharacterized protein (TIGR02271 family)